MNGGEGGNSIEFQLIIVEKMIKISPLGKHDNNCFRQEF